MEACQPIQAHAPPASVSGRKLLRKGTSKSAGVSTSVGMAVQEDEDAEHHLGYTLRQPLLHLGSQVWFIPLAHAMLCDVGGFL